MRGMGRDGRGMERERERRGRVESGEKGREERGEGKRKGGEGEKDEVQRMRRTENEGGK